MTNIQFIFYLIGIITSIAIMLIVYIFFININHSANKEVYKQEDRDKVKDIDSYKIPHMILTLQDGTYLGWSNCKNQADFENHYRDAKFRYLTLVYVNDTDRKFLYMPDTNNYYEFVNFEEFNRWKDFK